MKLRNIKATEVQEETTVLQDRHYNLELLNQESIRFLYTLRLANKLKEHQEETVEESYDQLKRCMKLYS